MAGKYHETTCNYSGRTVDMLLLQFSPMPSSDVVVTPNITASPRIVTGIEKLVQRFALTFLTQVGTVMNVSSEGTEFMGLLGSGKIYDGSTLRAAAASANKATYLQLMEEDESMSTPDDEAIESSEIQTLDIDRSTATVYITIAITSKAGDSYVYTTPLETGV